MVIGAAWLFAVGSTYYDRHAGCAGVVDGVLATSCSGGSCSSRGRAGSRKMIRNAAASGTRHAHAVTWSASDGRW
jgi:hypothetical protein